MRVPYPWGCVVFIKFVTLGSLYTLSSGQNCIVSFWFGTPFYLIFWQIIDSCIPTLLYFILYVLNIAIMYKIGFYIIQDLETFILTWMNFSMMWTIHTICY